MIPFEGPVQIGDEAGNELHPLKGIEGSAFDSLAIDRRDRLYVTQGRKRGVSVFGLVYE